MSEDIKCQCGNSSFSTSVFPWGWCQKCNKSIENILKDEVGKLKQENEELRGKISTSLKAKMDAECAKMSQNLRDAMSERGIRYVSDARDVITECVDAIKELYENHIKYKEWFTAKEVEKMVKALKAAEPFTDKS